MSTNWENALRSLGVVIVFCVLGWVAQATNLTNVIGGNWAGILAAVATLAISALDKYYSPDGTVLAGTVGVRK